MTTDREIRRNAAALYVHALKLAAGDRAHAAEALTVAMTEMETRIQRDAAREESRRFWIKLSNFAARFGVELR
jgi:hypothetical protein